MKKVSQTIPKSFKEILIKGLEILSVHNENKFIVDEHYEQFDILTLKALLNSGEMVINLPFDKYANFTSDNGIDFPEFCEPKEKEEVVELTITKEDFLRWYFNYGQDTEIRDSRYDIGECIIGQLLKTGVGSISAQEIFDGCSHDSVRAYFTQEHYMLTDKYDVELSDLGIKYNLTLID